MVPRSTIHKQKRKFFALVSVSLCLLLLPLTFHKTTPRFWESSGKRHKEEQWLLVQLEEVAKLHQTERVAQKARREAEEKAWEEAERQRVAEEEERWMVEYLQWL